MPDGAAGKRREEAALAMRVAGATFEEIAAALGISSARYSRAMVERALANQVTPADRERHRELQGKRLERLLRSVWPKAVDPANMEHLTAVRAAKDLIDRYCKLYGLDEPVEVLVHTPTTVELENWVAAVLAANEVVDVQERDVIEGVVVDELPTG